MWLTFFMAGGEKKIEQTEQKIKPNGILENRKMSL